MTFLQIHNSIIISSFKTIEHGHFLTARNKHSRESGINILCWNINSLLWFDMKPDLVVHQYGVTCHVSRY